MSEQRVRTRVRTAEGWRGLQQFLVAERGEPAIEAVELEGIGEARPTPEALAAIESAEAIVIGPSNPVISIGPILAVPGMREAIDAAPAPVVAVSPYVGGEVIKGPTDSFMKAIGRPSTAAGVASLYAGLLDGMVCDEGDPDAPPEGVTLLTCPTLMEGQTRRREVAEQTLKFAASLRRQD
jgi:LPPG:FO 2-phospho-L-lactate transferase